MRQRLGGFGDTQTTIPDLPLSNCVTQGRVRNSSVPKLHHFAYKMGTMQILASDNYNGIK